MSALRGQPGSGRVDRSGLAAVACTPRDACRAPLYRALFDSFAVSLVQPRNSLPCPIIPSRAVAGLVARRARPPLPLAVLFARDGAANTSAGLVGERVLSVTGSRCGAP